MLTAAKQVFEADSVTFTYRECSNHGKLKRMTLDAFEFIRRFLLHILPDGFVKIRHLGILANRELGSEARPLKGASRGVERGRFTLEAS